MLQKWAFSPYVLIEIIGIFPNKGQVVTPISSDVKVTQAQPFVVITALFGHFSGSLIFRTQVDFDAV